MPSSSQKRRRSSSHSPRQSARSHQQHQAPPTAAAASSTSDEKILLNVEEACNKHKLQHHRGQTGFVADPQDPLHERCKNCLEALGTLLSRVEAAFPADGKIRAIEVSGLCKFYWTILGGLFCPHSPYLFDWGRDYVNILRRVNYFFQHLSTKSIIQNAFETQNKEYVQMEVEGQENEPEKSVASDVCDTIAHLLNLVSERQMQKRIVSDLLALALDLATIAEADILNDQESEALEIIIFEETIQSSNDHNEEFTLHLASTEELLALQAGTFTVLEALLTLQRTKRFECRDVESSPSTVLSSTSVDCYFFYCVGDSDMMSTFVASAKQALLFRPSADPGKDEPKEAEILWKLSVRNKIAASNLMCMLLKDWNRIGESDPCALAELALLIPRAVFVYFDSISKNKQSCDYGDESVYASLLSQLICHAILFPTRMGGHQLVSETLWNIRSQALVPLLDCIPVIAGGDADSDTSRQGSDMTAWSSCWCEEEMTLRIIVLRAIHAALYTENPSSNSSFEYTPLSRQASSHCIATGTFPYLFTILKEASLTSVAIAIISKLLQPRNDDSANAVFDFANICRVAWLDRTRNQDENVDKTDAREAPDIGTEVARSDPNRSSPLSSAKRKRLNFSLKGNSSLPKQLQIERSPKRQRPRGDSGSMGQPLQGASSVATPSPFSGLDTHSEADNSKEITSSCSIDQCFVLALNDALGSADKIISSFGSSSVSIALATASESNAENTLGGVLFITSVSRLMLDILHQSMRQSEPGQGTERYKGALDILSCLFRSLKKLCISLVSNSTEAPSPRVVKTMELITDVGLRAHFTMDTILTRTCVAMPDFVPVFQNALDMFSRVALTAWTTVVETDDAPSILGALSEAGKEQHNVEADKGTAEVFCGGLCQELFQAFGSTKRMALGMPSTRDKRSCSPCLCKFLAESPEECSESGVLHKKSRSACEGNPTSRGNVQIDFQQDSAVFLLDFLPRQSKWALLACLRPVERGSFIGEVLPDTGAIVTSGIAAAPSTLESLSILLGPSKTSSTKSSDASVASALTVLPILMLSLGSIATSHSERDSSSNQELAEGTSGNQKSLVAGSGSYDDDVVSRMAFALSEFDFLQHLLQRACSPFTNPGSTYRRPIARAACVSLMRVQEVFELILAEESFDKNPASRPSLPSFSFVLSNAHSLLAYLTSRPKVELISGQILRAQSQGEIRKTATLQDVYRNIRITLLSSQYADTISNMPADVRLEMWKCLAWTCMHSSRSDSRQLNVEPQQMVEIAMKFSGRADNEHVLEGAVHDGDGGNDEVQRTPKFVPSLLWLVHAAFADSDPIVRNYASREIGPVLLGNNSQLLQALFCSDEEWSLSQKHVLVSAASLRLTQAITPTVERLFKLVGHFLCHYCRVPLSQLSLTMGYNVTSEAGSLAADNVKPDSHDDPSTAISFQRSAIYALSSLCQHAELDTACGILVFEHALLRLVRFWIAIENQICDEVSQKNSISALALAQISGVNLRRPLGEVVMNKCKTNFIPALFADILVPSSSPFSEGDETNQLDCIAPECRERQYHLLSVFIESFLILSRQKTSDNTPERDDESGERAPALRVLDFVDHALPSVLPAMVIWQDYNSLRLTTGFRLFLLGEKRRIENIKKRFNHIGTNTTAQHGDVLVGNLPTESTPRARSRIHGIKESTKELDEHTKLLCLSPRQLQHILPKILLHPEGGPLVFFLQTVVRNKVTLQQMLGPSHLKLLKTLVWQLGSEDSADDESTFQHKEFSESFEVRAIKKAALVLEQETLKGNPENAGRSISGAYDATKRLTSLDGVERDAERPAGRRAASRWISSSFMYLLVNAVQLKWKSRTPEEKIRSLRCLKAILHFLDPDGSPQYIPQIMATINMAMSDDLAIRDDRMRLKDALRLRLLAVQSLSHFVRIVVKDQPQSIGSDLTTIVVSLFPVLCPQEAFEQHTEEFRCIERATEVAVELLEWLVAGDLGKQLAPFFSEIPFLPPSQNLDTVRAALKANGVNFDNLLVLSSTPHTTTQLSTGGSVNSENGTFSRPHFSSHMQAALHKRLDMLCPLLSHENVNVRRVVLRHLTDLLCSNRLLFHRTVENQDGSVGHHMTVVYSKPAREGCDANMGSVAALVKSLLTRCVLEDDAETRKLLATTIGEVGAIDSNRIGDINTSNVERADDGLWRLLQPPWQSRVTRYELQLVTNHLVVALKAAPTSADQHKIAFTIQQLLVLLNASAEHSTPGDKHEPIEVDSDVKSCHQIDANGDESSSGPSKDDKGEINLWLVEKLRKAGVHEIIEPFWSTSFHEPYQTSHRNPPFFRISQSYFQWLSRWCGFMVKRSKESSGSRWRDFFFACRPAIRSTAGIGVAEFIIPVLVLDSMCFGDSLDERVVLQEIQDALTFSETDSWDSSASFGSDTKSSSMISMSLAERQKAVNCAFAIIDTLEYWAERETEERHKGSRQKIESRLASTGRGIDSISPKQVATSHWPSDQSIARIEDFLQAIPLSLRARAAAAVGMHARALRILELEARAHVVDSVFNNTHEQRQGEIHEQKKEHPRPLGSHLVDGIDRSLLKQVLSNLDDCYTMKAVGQESHRIDIASKLRDSIREREAYGDWSGAVQDYERALQLEEEIGNTPRLQKGMLRGLLELGQFESVLNQVNGIVCQRPSGNRQNTTDSRNTSNYAFATPFAVEAAWRLGRWSTLEKLVDDENNEEKTEVDTEGLYQLSVGRAMLGLKKRSSCTVDTALKEAREAVMMALSGFARESYARCYDQLLRLHCLREIENASECLCSGVRESERDTLGISSASVAASSYNMYDEQEWNARLDLVSSLGATTIITARLALARLAEDSKTEGSLFLTVGKTARKSGLYHIAENFLAQAEAAFTRLRSPNNQRRQTHHLDDFLSSVRMQLAKLKHCEGESGSALKILGQDDVQQLVNCDENILRERVGILEREKSQIPVVQSEGDNAHIDRFARRLLQSTQWMVEGGLKGGSEVMSRFRLVQRLCPKWEKSYFYFAKYVDSLLECRIAAMASQPAQLGVDDDALRASIFFRDASCQKYLLLAMKQYGEALKVSSKHVYQALPRLLTLWFDFTSINGDELFSQSKTPSASVSGRRSRGGIDPHEHFCSSQNEANELMITLYKAVPAQSFYTAMPQLISRVGHRDKDTVRMVLIILVRVLIRFPSQALWALAWLRNSVSQERSSIGDKIFKEAQKSFQKNQDKKSHDLLVASKSLFKFLIDLAKFIPKEGARACNIRPWTGDVELMDFVPPVQAALTVSRPSLGKTSSRDVFPALIPRMRSFCSQVQIMTSKARPKKLKAFAVPAQQLRSPRSPSNSTAAKVPQPGDIGEMHFLVKQEAKGDLRKDARVQDLNNVINRLLATSSSGGTASRQRRRLHLRTFSVVCLSEECGILEWVPHTDSLRNLVSASYNPQAAPFSIRRRGYRIGNWGDINLRKSFEQCQAMYKTNGHLTRAAQMFEEQCLKPYPPVLYWWFVQNFHDPHAWYEARTRFTMSAAAWSAVGHVIGLGDRHSENILVDKSTGDCVHVDFDCIFDKGLNLPQPEVVPFRLTANMLDAFGPTGADGTYSGCLKSAMSTLRGNRDTLLSVLEPFLKDPVIDWKRHRSQQKQSDKTNSRETMAAKRSIKVIDGRLKGIYNLRVHPSKRIRRTDGVDQDDEMTHLLPLSVEGQVHKMITEATSCENLVQIYVGWMPWL